MKEGIAGMAVWLGENLGTIVVTLILAAIVTMAVRNVYKNVKEGKCACCSDSGHCSMRGTRRQKQIKK